MSTAAKGRLRAVVLELAAEALEEIAGEVAGVLRDAATPTLPRPGPRPYSAEWQLPMPEQGDRLSGLARETAIRGGAIPPADGITEQDGLTEAEHEAQQR